MTFNLLFITVSLNKRTYSQEEVLRELEVQRISEEITDRKCSVQHRVY
ncbi:YrzI family small protein [Bacillus suaedaesalsae]|uniref:YrzI family small protein n=1 Tax=Bacillus suaedaesalsae TaxID=2810349 RepID=A0ABS2DMI0_9BACI|nr:YrzI family small protein [Bacillus suaedaesalsae]MBM6619668.1 YrzI family small protein [Bacillus suaedaesalsae]